MALNFPFLLGDLGKGRDSSFNEVVNPGAGLGTLSAGRRGPLDSGLASMQTERTARKTYRTRDEAKTNVFDYIECFYNHKDRHSTIGYLSPMEFEMQAGLA
jgi:transposase InsO family protein